MKTKHTCKFCGEPLRKEFVDLGLQPLSNDYIPEDKLDEGQYYFPLKVMVCEKCKLVQALEYQNPEKIFSEYKYFSSFSKSWLQHCEKYVDMIVSRLKLGKQSQVCEIACNDGYLLQYFNKYKIPAYGVEPAANVAKYAQRKGIDVDVAFFLMISLEAILTDGVKQI